MKLDGSGIAKVSDISGTSKSIIGDWIYYCNPRIVLEPGIYKVKKDGSSKTKITSDGAMFINVVGDWIYYTSSQNGETAIYKIKTDGTGKVKISISDKNYVMVTNEEFVVVGEYIYCNLNGKSEGSTVLVRMKNDGSILSKLSNSSQHFAISNGYIYYLSSNNQEIWKMKIDGSSKTLVYKVANHSVYSINVAGNNIYFSADNQTAELKYAGIYKMNVDGSGLARIYK
jgi:Tol biopolymer transport system component